MLWKIFLSRHTLRTHQTTCAGQPYLALDGASGKEPAHQCRSDVRDTGWIPRLQRSPGGRHGNPLQHSRLENPRGQRSLASCSPQAHIESNKTEATQHRSTHKVQPHFWFGNTSGAISDRCQILRSQTRKQQLSLAALEPPLPTWPCRFLGSVPSGVPSNESGTAHQSSQPVRNWIIVCIGPLPLIEGS